MTLRFSFASRRPSASAAFQPPLYQAQETPFAESVSPTVFSVCGASGWRAGSARSRLPPAAGGMPLGWYGGCVVFTDQPSGEPEPSKNCPTPCITEAGEVGRFCRLPAASRRAFAVSGALSLRGVQAQISHRWLRYEPP